MPIPVEGEVARGIGRDRVQNVRLTDNGPEARAVLDLIFSNHFSWNEPGAFEALRDALLRHGDSYRHLADLRFYLEAVERLTRRYADQDTWASRAWPVQESCACQRIRSKGCNTIHAEIFAKGVPHDDWKSIFCDRRSCLRHEAL